MEDVYQNLKKWNNMEYNRLAYEWVGSCPCEDCKLNCHADDDFDLEECREDCDDYLEWRSQYSNKYKEFLSKEIYYKL